MATMQKVAPCEVRGGRSSWTLVGLGRKIMGRYSDHRIGYGEGGYSGSEPAFKRAKLRLNELATLMQVAYVGRLFADFETYEVDRNKDVLVLLEKGNKVAAVANAM